MAVLIILSSFKTFINFATSISFLTAPFIAIINHKAMLSPEIPLEQRPSKFLQTWSVIGVISMFLAGGYFIFSKLFMSV
jgi:Mn2+/Fe2+ NRAMP family transporter